MISKRGIPPGWRWLFSTLLLAASVSPIHAQPSAVVLAQATLEELMDIRVTSAARKSQRAEDVAAATFVITREDIRRSGYTTLPEVLRLAPGVQVAQVSASSWAISIRGFNDLYANKLLVLVDGRSIYTRTFSGVLWDMQDLVLADIERIEVIRGPGGASWGANAVNGVINVITRSAAETQGLAVDLSRGSFARERVGVRYGDRVGSMAYRVYSQWSAFADSAPVGPTSFSDRWHSLTTGVRTDWARGADAVIAQAHVNANRTRAGSPELSSLVPGSPVSVDGVGEGLELSLLSRWTRTRTDGTAFQVQGYHMSTRRDQPFLRSTERSTDVDAQYERPMGTRHGVMFGGGYRHIDLSTRGTLTMALGSARLTTANAFLQDEIAVTKNVAVTLGSKIEHDTYGGWGVLPSSRVMWSVTPGQRLWASASRARRTPSIADRDFRLVLARIPAQPLPIVFSAIGSQTYGSEYLTQAEGGYRVRLGSSASVDATLFTGSYRDIRTYEPAGSTLDLSFGVPLLMVDVAPANLATARASGGEITAFWTPLPIWRLDGSYSYLAMTSRTAPSSVDVTVQTLADLAPSHQWQVRSDLTPVARLRLGASLARTGELRSLDVPGYVRLDARVAYQLASGVSAAIVGQNLSRARHREHAGDMFLPASSMPRSVRVDLRWEF